MIFLKTLLKHGQMMRNTWLQVVNDVAERGVKLCNDFIGSSRDEERFQNILQVVENHRKAQPNQRKRVTPSVKN